MLQRWRCLSRTMVLLIGVVLLGLATPPASASAASTGKSGLQGWRTFHDPVYGFSLSYPASWTLTFGNDGSHITLLNPATKTTMSPLVITVQTQTIAGHKALDYVLPHLPTAASLRRPAADPAQQVRQVVVPVSNTAGSINVYTFLLTQPTNASGKLSITEQTESTTFATIL